jgi:hypothetical protein
MGYQPFCGLPSRPPVPKAVEVSKLRVLTPIQPATYVDMVEPKPRRKPRRERYTHRSHIRIDRATWDAIAEKCAETGLTPSEIVRAAIQSHLKKEPTTP